MGRLILSEEEKNKIRNQHKGLKETNGSLKWGHNLLFEQEEDIEVGTVKDGKVFKGYETKRIEESFDEIGMYAVNQDNPSKFLNKFVAGIIKTIKSDADMEASLMAGTLELATANIRSGASNWYRTPLDAEVDNDYKSDVNFNYYTNPEWFPAGVESLSGPDTQDWKDNKALAQRRSTKFLTALKDALLANKPPIKIFPAIEETVSSSIIDTGALTDKKCKEKSECAKFFPNPGQFVDAKLDFIYGAKKETWEDFVECAGGMKVSLGYYVTPDLIKKIASEDGSRSYTDLWNRTKQSDITSFNGGRASTQYHQCDRAVFELYFNDVSIGQINLNNGTGKKAGLSRKGTLTVTPEMVQSIIENTKGSEDWVDNELSLQIRGTKGANSHSEVPWVTMTNGRGENIMDTEAMNVSSYNSSATNYAKKIILFGPFNPCNKIV